jgi:hypothetical protein
MSRKLAVLAMVVLVLLVAATPSLAAGGGPHGGPGGAGPGGQGGEGGRSLFALVGTITEIGGDTITVQVVEGNRFVWPYVGGTLDIEVTVDTLFYEWTPEGRVPITVADIAEGDLASIHGTVTADGAFIADWVTVDIPDH